MALDYKVVGKDTELEALLNARLTSVRSHFLEVGPKKLILPGKFKEVYETIKNYEVYDDDVWICGFPKTGTRLMQQMAWLLTNDLDFKSSEEIILELRSPYFEMESYWDDIPYAYLNLERITQLKRPRCLKSHLPWPLLPEAITSGAKQPKIIVTLRAAEDVCTSFYYQNKSEFYTGTWEEFCQLFLGGKITFGPFFENVLSFWEQRHRANILMVKYTDLINDFPGVVRKVAEFLGKTVTNDDVDKVCAHLKLDNLKKCRGFNLSHHIECANDSYVRKGIVGDYKNEMSPETIEEFRKQTEEKLSGTGLTF